MHLCRFYLSLSFCMVNAVVYGQQKPVLWSFAEIQEQYKQPKIKGNSPVFLGRKDTITIAPTLNTALPLPINFYTLHMGAVCKVELKMQKQLNFPLFIRMGSKDYVDGLEGKLRRQ